ncbi:hypothetical protein Ocin01_02430 [Orchesella cincta]|uniref:LisH domain-containing protein n=1 Tax=Orchesella cincta TaxID=48709 RepID=A0A1D2NGY7_ORCCI|nr:hypothetical protein Ocin01_02430 [Orchesella cincta]
MDPFLPGEIPVMVLRYLASNKCETAALAMIEEMPMLKAYVPPKPAKLSNSDYLKYLARSSVNSGLKDVLSDYGNSKILAEEILENESNILLDFPLDGLVNKLKIIKDLIKTKPSTSSATTSPTTSAKKIDSGSQVDIVKVDGCSNTDENYLCPQCLINQAKMEQKTESSCQTDEVTTVQFGVQDKIPVIFCKTLLNDGDLQQKIAQTINEHLEVPQDERNDFVQKVSSKAETEIDKFLVELLQDMPEDSNGGDSDGGLQSLVDNGPSIASVYAEVDSNLSAMFGESEMLFGTDPNLQTSTERDSQTSSSSSSGRNSNLKDTTSIPPEPDKIPVSSLSTSLDTESVKTLKPQSSSSGLSTPKQVQRGSSVKRITPTPLTSANVNPVFNTSVVIEKQLVDGGDKSAQFSVVTVNSEPPAWQKLNRKSIAPKIPGPPKVTDNITVVNKSREEVIKYGSSKKNGRSVTNDSRTKGRITNEISPPRSKKTAPIQPTSSHKRKAPPVKLTPEKAKNIEYNFMHVYHDSNKPSSGTKSNEIDSTPSNVSSVKNTPVASSSVLETGTNNNNNPTSDVVLNMPLVNENSQNDVTPMQPPPEAGSSSEFKTISPNALHRLIASAHKHMGSTAVPVHFPKRKSYSTPRKRKHVRNLSFATPPSLKATTPQNGAETDASKKRKADDEWFAAELKSKKRLNWPESEKKKTPHVAQESLKTTERPQISADSQETAKRTVIIHPGAKPPSNSDDNISQKANMSIILEESVVEPPQPAAVDANVVNDSSGLVQVTNVWNQSSSSKVAYVTVPSNHVDSSMQLYQLGADMQSLYPIHFIPPGSSGVNSQIQPSQNPTSNSLTFHSQPLQDPIPLPSKPPCNVQVLTPKAAPHSEQNSAATPTQPYLPSIFSPVHLTQPYKRHPTISPLALPNQNPPTVLVPATDNSTSGSTIIPPTTSSSSLSVKKPPNLFFKESMDSKKPEKRQRQTLSVDIPITNNNLATVTPLPSSQRVSAESVIVNSSALVSTRASELDSPNNPDSRQRGKRQCRSKSDNSASSTTTPPTLLVEQGTSRRTRKSARISEIQNHPENEDVVKGRGGSSSERSRARTQSKSTDVTHEQKDTTNVETSTTATTAKDANPKVKGTRGKAVQKKPKIIMRINTKDLFGDSPSKNKSLKCNTRRSPEAVAAQMVAADALPLGSPRRSPRKHPIMTKQLDKSPFHKPSSLFGSLSSSENSENSSNKGLSLLPPQENTVFNIVPAPLGFPEPTPIKNYIETGFLNISGIGFNSPLITPLKSNPPPPLNDTHFTLPPTPRIVVDQDSNSSSMHSLKLIYDGLYPVNLLTSTPLKSGLPRTPGKESGSSNSHSPLPKPAEGEPTGTTSQIVPPPHVRPPLPPSTNPQQRFAVTNNAVTTTNNEVAALDLSSPRDKDKSDGELSSSDSDHEAPKTTCSKTTSLKQVQKVVPLPPQPSTCIPPPRHPTNTRPYNTSSYATQVVRPVQQHQQRPVSHPQISISVSPNIGQTHGISFHVGGHKKVLTLSEQETVVSLMQMQNTGHRLEKVKENAPVQFRPAAANLQKPSANVNVPDRQKPNAEASSSDHHNMLRGVCVGDLIKMVHRKYKLPPKNN